MGSFFSSYKTDDNEELNKVITIWKKFYLLYREEMVFILKNSFHYAEFFNSILIWTVTDNNF